MNSGWMHRKIGDVIALEYGKSLPKDQRSQGSGYPAYGANGIKCFASEPYCDGPSIIVGRKGSAGAVRIVDEPFWPLDVTFYVNFDDRENDLKFLYYLLKVLDLPSLATGVKPGINRNVVYAIEQKFPPLQEQKRIVAILDEAFAGIDAAIVNTEKNLASAKALFESHQESVFRAFIATCSEVALSAHTRFIDYRGRTPRKTTSGLRLITAKNVRMGFLQKTPEEFVEPETYDAWMRRGIPDRGDILFTTEAPLGFVCQLDTSDKVVLAQRIITIQPDRDTLDPVYLKYALMSPPIQKRIHEQATGATATGIKSSLLKKISIPLPELAEQCVVAEKLEHLERECYQLASLYEKKKKLLLELKQSLLQKAFAGELTAGTTETEAREATA